MGRDARGVIVEERTEAFEYEVVCVIDEHSLVDSESYQRPYRRPLGKTLERGFYIVIQFDPAASSPYGESAEFIGPFASPALARTAMEGPRSVDSISMAAR